MQGCKEAREKHEKSTHFDVRRAPRMFNVFDGNRKFGNGRGKSQKASSPEGVVWSIYAVHWRIVHVKCKRKDAVF